MVISKLFPRVCQKFVTHGFFEVVQFQLLGNANAPATSFVISLGLLNAMIMVIYSGKRIVKQPKNNKTVTSTLEPPIFVFSHSCSSFLFVIFQLDDRECNNYNKEDHGVCTLITKLSAVHTVSINQIEMDSVLCAGPPFVKDMIWSNTISVFLVLNTKLMETNGINIGSVSFQNFCHGFAPSISPAS